MANLGANCVAGDFTFTGVGASDRCKTNPGVRRAYFSFTSSLDLTAMEIVPTNFVLTDCGSIVNFVMQAGEVFVPIENDGLSTTYARAKQGGKYLHTLTFEYIGFSCSRDCQLSALENLLCNGVLVVELNDCTNILLGLTATTSGGTVTLAQDSNKMKVTQDDLDAKTIDSDEDTSHIFTVTYTTTHKGICVIATTIPT